MRGGEIVAYDPTRRRNARAIVDAASLGWLQPSDLVLDLTHKTGRFWSEWRPDPAVGGRLVRSDLDSDGELWAGGHLDMVADALALPDVWRERADVTVWDPPYKENGSGGSCAEDDRYGVADGWVPRRGLLAAGVVAAVSWTRDGGVVLVKCQDQTAGRFHPQTTFATVAAELAGAAPIGVLHVAGTTRPQPADGRAQRSPRNRTSALMAFRVSGRRRVDVDPWAVAAAVERHGLRGLLGALPRRWEPPEAPLPTWEDALAHAEVLREQGVRVEIVKRRKTIEIYDANGKLHDAPDGTPALLIYSIPSDSLKHEWSCCHGELLRKSTPIPDPPPPEGQA